MFTGATKKAMLPELSGARRAEGSHRRPPESKFIQNDSVSNDNFS
jgi:hypothetical protein